MRKILLTVGVVLATTLTACGTHAGDGDAGGPIKLGAWLPLSGPQASGGLPQEAGTQAFFDQLNAAGGIHGRPVEWTPVDNAFDPQQTIQVARQLVSRDRVVAIVGANGTATTEATFPFVLEQNKIPVFGTYGAPPPGTTRRGTGCSAARRSTRTRRALPRSGHLTRVPRRSRSSATIRPRS